jgi:hypothetical protein
VGKWNQTPGTVTGVRGAGGGEKCSNCAKDTDISFMYVGLTRGDRYEDGDDGVDTLIEQWHGWGGVDQVCQRLYQLLTQPIIQQNLHHYTYDIQGCKCWKTTLPEEKQIMADAIWENYMKKRSGKIRKNRRKTKEEREIGNRK